MNNKFDELAKNLAQSVTRREAFKRFGVGLAGMVLACFGLANKAEAGGGGCEHYDSNCKSHNDCCSGICLNNGRCGCSTVADCKGRYNFCANGVCIFIV
jgi:hypothetical protein